MIREIRFTKEQVKELLESRGLNEVEGVKGRGWAVLRHKSGDITKIELLNLVTDAGDTYYAQLAAAESPTNDFKGANAGLLLGTGTNTPAKGNTSVQTVVSGSGKTRKSTYPKTNDTGDSDNTGDGLDILTWTYEYLTSEANANSIAEAAIVNNTTTPTAALTRFLFAAPFNKTSNDTLKVIVNHQFNGI